jgi:hypothetical protein
MGVTIIEATTITTVKKCASITLGMAAFYISEITVKTD